MSLFWDGQAIKSRAIRLWLVLGGIWLLVSFSSIAFDTLRDRCGDGGFAILIYVTLRATFASPTGERQRNYPAIEANTRYPNPGTAILAQFGIILLTIQIWISILTASTGIIFFSAHPLLNSIGLLFLTQSIILLQPTHTPRQKTLGTHIHFILNFVGVGSLLAGLVVIEMNKADHPESRFTSPHGILGLVTYILLFLQALVGFAQFYIPTYVFGSVDGGKKIYKYHRGSGYLVLAFMLATVLAATQTGFNLNVLHMRVWVIVVLVLLVVIGVVPRIKKGKFGF